MKSILSIDYKEPLVRQTKPSLVHIPKNIMTDLLVVNMCIYLLSEANTKDTKENIALIKLSNKTYKINEKIKAKNKDILAKLYKTIDTIHSLASNRKAVVKWCDSRWYSKDVTELFSSVTRTNLEFLANQILFTNFVERDKPLHPALKWLGNKEMHYEMYDLLELTNAEAILDIIVSDTNRVIKVLKG